MKQNQKKNLGVVGFFAAILVYALLLQYSVVALVASVVAILAMLLVAVVYKKDQRVIDKIDVYLFFTGMGILAMHFPQMREAYAPDLLSEHMEYVKAIQIVAPIAGIVIGLILRAVARRRKTLVAETLNLYLGMFAACIGLSVFCWRDPLHLPNVLLLVVLLTLFGTISFCRANWTDAVNALARPSRLALLSAFLSIAIPMVCPGFQLTQYNALAFLSCTVLPWYAVLISTLGLLTIVGMGVYYGKDLMDEDTIFLSGVVGLIWVVKAAAYFYFNFCWIAVLAYVLLFLRFTNRFEKENGYERKSFLGQALRDNEVFWVLLSAVCVVAAIYLVHIGYIYFLISLVVGAAAVQFLHKGVSGWGREAAFWITLLFCIALAACAFSLQNGFSEKKILFIVMLFLFSAAVMWMLNHKNFIGRNRFRAGKIAMTALFVLLVAIPAVKAGSAVTVTFENESANVGALLKEETRLLITAEADGNDNAVKSVKYVWTDSLFYDEDAVVEAEEPSLELEIESNHLILWVEDTYGVVTRKDCWFYGTAREAWETYEYLADMPEEEVDDDWETEYDWDVNP